MRCCAHWLPANPGIMYPCQSSAACWPAIFNFRSPTWAPGRRCYGKPKLMLSAHLNCRGKSQPIVPSLTGDCLKLSRLVTCVPSPSIWIGHQTLWRRQGTRRKNGGKKSPHCSSWLEPSSGIQRGGGWLPKSTSLLFAVRAKSGLLTFRPNVHSPPSKHEDERRMGKPEGIAAMARQAHRLARERKNNNEWGLRVL